MSRKFLLFRGRSDFDVFDWIAEFAPGVQAALQRADAFDALFSEEQRHTGAGGFVWSSTVENDLTVERQPIGFLFQFFGVHTKCAGNRFRVGSKVHGVTQINDDQLYAAVNFLFQFFWSDARYTQLAQQSFPSEKLPTH